jgi:hypothetical protein
MGNQKGYGKFFTTKKKNFEGIRGWFRKGANKFVFKLPVSC